MESRNILKDQTLLTPEEASKYLRLSIESIYDLLHQGDLEGKKADRGWVIERSHLESLLEAWGEREELPD
jgi:excisionase family DNA binding protein